MAIAIADVASWVAEGSPVDNYAEKAGQTLYNNGRVVAPMLPTSLSTRCASLRSDGVARPALAYCFTVEGGVVWKTNAGAAPTLNTSGYTVIVLWKVSTQVYGARVGDA